MRCKIFAARKDQLMLLGIDGSDPPTIFEITNVGFRYLFPIYIYMFFFLHEHNLIFFSCYWWGDCNVLHSWMNHIFFKLLRLCFVLFFSEKEDHNDISEWKFSFWCFVFYFILVLLLLWNIFASYLCHIFIC